MALKLPRFQQGEKVVDERGQFTTVALTRFQQRDKALEDQEASQDTVLANLTTLTNDLAAAVADIQATMRRDSISASFTVPTLVAEAADAGADVTITIVDHERHYGDETFVEVDGDTITAQPYSTLVAIYYDDEDREGGAVTYQVTTDLKTAQNNYAAGRHYVATLTTPAAAAPPTSGGSPPPGSGYSGSGGFGTVIP